MSAVPTRDRRAERYAATRAEILEAAWQLVRAHGLGSLAMRELGVRVGMRAQSLYAYFPSKHAIYDAMFAASNEELLARASDLPLLADPVGRMRRNAHLFVEFCVEDQARYQLLFQRTIPGFEPSPESFASAIAVLETGHTALRDIGITDRRAIDAWFAILAGVVAQQNANEPGGDRWVRLVDELADMYLAHYRPAKNRGTR